MNRLTAIVVFLLMCLPAYAREYNNSRRTSALLQSAIVANATAAETDGDDTNNDEADDQHTDGTDTEDQDGDDSDNEADDGDDNDTNEADTDDTDDQADAGDKDDSDDDGADDDNNNTTTAASLKAAQSRALARSKSSLNRLAAALNEGLKPQQTIARLLAADDGRGIPVSSALQKAVGTGKSGIAASAGSVSVPTSAAMADSVTSDAGALSATAVPEPAAWFLAAFGCCLASDIAAQKRRRSRIRERRPHPPGS
jgi:hypothetical protein